MKNVLHIFGQLLAKIKRVDINEIAKYIFVNWDDIKLTNLSYIPPYTYMR